MVTMTLAVPPELKTRMDARPEINWSAVARQAFERQLQDMSDLEFFRKLQEKSTMTEQDALELGKLVNKGMAERYRALSTQMSSSRRSFGKG
ncbi:MAG: hypothetical protein V1837_06300 [Candidatus Woesearchaeota archaeon]